MIIKNNEPISKYTTFRIGGVARKMFFPETIEELQDVINENGDIANHVIGGGSNLLINDECRYDSVLCLRNFNLEMKNMGQGRYYVGASVRLQKLIKAINEDGYGGIEYLYSVPGLVGGGNFYECWKGESIWQMH